MRRCARKQGLLALAGWLTATAGAASGFQLGPVFTEAHPQVDVVLETPPGTELPEARDLLLLEDGQPAGTAQTVLPFSSSGHDLAVVVAVDVSGTMAGAPLEQLQSALRALASTRGPREEVALVSFADDIVVECPFGGAESELTAAIDRLAPRGRITELYKGLFKALDLLAEQRGSRLRLLVVSDGKDEGEAYQLDDVIERARALRVPVDAAGLTRIDTRYLSTLERLADLTGGAYGRAESSQDLESLVGSGLARLRSTPVARFTLQKVPRDGARHRLGVRWTRGTEVVEAEAPVVMPPPSPASEPEPSPVPEDEEEATPNQEVGWTLWIAGGAVALVLGLSLWWLARSRRRTVAPQPPSYAPAPEPLEPRPAPPVPPRPAAVPPPPSPEPARAARRATQFRHELARPQPGSPAVVLQAEGGALAGARFPVDRDPFWIGAEEGNDLTVAQDNYLSGRHACLYFYQGSLLLRDQGSTNGTFLNGERLGEVPAPVGLGDRIRVGRTDLLVVAP